MDGTETDTATYCYRATSGYRSMNGYRRVIDGIDIEIGPGFQNFSDGVFEPFKRRDRVGY